jgi:hypothetical protein
LVESVGDRCSVAVPAEHDYLEMAMGRFEPGYELPTVPSRERSVNHGNMEMLLACGVQRLIRTTHPNNAHSAAREAADQDFKEILVIIDQQNGVARCHLVAYRYRVSNPAPRLRFCPRAR